MKRQSDDFTNKLKSKEKFIPTYEPFSTGITVVCNRNFTYLFELGVVAEDNADSPQRDGQGEKVSFSFAFQQEERFSVR